MSMLLERPGPSSSIAACAATTFSAQATFNSWHAPRHSQTSFDHQQQLQRQHQQQYQPRQPRPRASTHFRSARTNASTPQYVLRRECDDVDMNSFIFPGEEPERFRSHQQPRFVHCDPICVDEPTVFVDPFAEQHQLYQQQQQPTFQMQQMSAPYYDNIVTPKRKPKRIEFCSLYDRESEPESNPELNVSEISLNSQSGSTCDSSSQGSNGDRVSLVDHDIEKTRRREPLTTKKQSIKERIYSGPETLRADQITREEPVREGSREHIETKHAREDTMRLQRGSASPEQATIALRHPSEPVSEAIYCFNASKAQSKEMESIRWAFTDEKIRRQVELERKSEEWGTIVERKLGIYFRPGKQRILLNQHQKNMNEAATRDFRCEEARHKQECILALQEKNSDFSMLPILGNRFILRRLLGKGGNGEVWDVIDYADNKRPCALKISTSYHHTQREHQIHSKLNHEYIVKVGPAPFTIEYNDKIYIAFPVESVDTDLQKLIEMFGPFDENSALKILFELLHALVYLHCQMDTAHYDLKPANILVSRDRCVKLTDFDLARSVSSPALSCDEGTPKYLPPECFHGHFGQLEDCTAEKADVWMVGVIFCAMLFGKHPIYPDKTPTDRMKDLMGQYTGQFQFSVESNAISTFSQQVIQGCLHPNPKCRPSAVQLLQALMNQMTMVAGASGGAQ